MHHAPQITATAASGNSCSSGAVKATLPAAVAPSSLVPAVGFSVTAGPAPGRPHAAPPPAATRQRAMIHAAVAGQGCSGLTGGTLSRRQTASFGNPVVLPAATAANGSSGEEGGLRGTGTRREQEQ